MKMFASRIAAIQGISHVIVEELSKATGKMQKKIQKNNERFSKRNPSVDPGESKSLQMVREYLSSRNVGDGAPTPAPEATSGGGIAPAKGGQDDDLSDIL